MPKWFSEDALAIEMKKTKVVTNKPVFLGFITPHLRKIRMYQFLYDYIKEQNGYTADLCNLLSTPE